MADAFLQDGVPYILRRGERFYFGYAQLDDDAEVIALHVATENKILDVEDFDEEYNEEDQSFRYSSGDYVYDVWPLTIENFQEFFPGQIRTFKDDFDLRDFIDRTLKGIYMADDVEYMYAVTVDDGEEGSREVLELVRLNAAGDMEYREANNWVAMEGDGEYPTIYDKHMIFIASENETDVLELWDAKELEDSSVAESEITGYAALV